jgi:hypothetical protein
MSHATTYNKEEVEEGRQEGTWHKMRMEYGGRCARKNRKGIKKRGRAELAWDSSEKRAVWRFGIVLT